MILLKSKGIFIIFIVMVTLFSTACSQTDQKVEYDDTDGVYSESAESNSSKAKYEIKSIEANVYEDEELNAIIIDPKDELSLKMTKELFNEMLDLAVNTENKIIIELRQMIADPDVAMGTFYSVKEEVDNYLITPLEQVEDSEIPIMYETGDASYYYRYYMIENDSMETSIYFTIQLFNNDFGVSSEYSVNSNSDTYNELESSSSIESNNNNELVGKWTYTYYDKIDIEGFEIYKNSYFEFKSNGEFTHYEPETPRYREKLYKGTYEFDKMYDYIVILTYKDEKEMFPKWQTKETHFKVTKEEGKELLTFYYSNGTKKLQLASLTGDCEIYDSIWVKEDITK